jgi:L-threonylcarbamoyladenylate synthase
MKTEVVHIDTRTVKQDQLDRISSVLKGGGVVAYPTDTFYGLGADCFSEEAVRTIYRLKNRDPSKPLSVIIADVKDLEKLVADIPPRFASLPVEFWPGPVTIVFKASAAVPDVLLGPSRSIGIRLPDFSWLRALVRHSGVFLTATSANRTSGEENRDPKKVLSEFSGKIDLMVDGGLTPGSLPSTIVDVSKDTFEVLREGVLSAAMFQKYLS